MTPKKIHLDRLGIITSVACAIHCTVLPLLLSSLPFLGIDIIENKVIEWSMISLSFLFGALSLVHGYIHHHRKFLPLVLFLIGFTFLILNQIIAEKFVFLFIPLSAIGIVSAHIFNIYHCRVCDTTSAVRKPD